MSEVTQPSLRRLAQFDVRPRRDLGQNFLVDSNILGVIARAAELDGADVALEIGGGLGVLSEYLAARVAHVHVIEIDRHLEPALRDALAPFANATLHIADAMALDLAALEPVPSKVIANLPYGIAAGAILRTIEELPTVSRWVAMVQREVGERLASPPGGRTYGIPSVLCQLACEVRVLRGVARSVFVPVPNVDSVLVGMTRTGPAAPPELRRFVQAAFAHRRKALARSLALAHRRRPRARARRARRPRPAGRRARRAALARRAADAVGGAGGVREPAPAKINLCLLVGPTRHDGRHDLVTVMQSITLADEIEMADAERDEVLCPAVAGPNLAAAALAAFREATGWDGPGQRIEIVKRIPVAAGLGGGSADAAAVLRLAARRSGRGDARLAFELSAALGSDVPGLLVPGRVLARGAGERVEPMDDPAPFGILVLPSAARLSTAGVYAEADRLGGLRSAAELEAVDPLAAVGVNDLEAAARSLEPTIGRALERARAAGARHAMVCGSGPTVIGLFDDLGLAGLGGGATLRAAGVEAHAAEPVAGERWRTPGGAGRPGPRRSG